MPTPIKLKRYTGSAYEILQPETTWSQITDKPSTFTPTAHTHVVADITDNNTLVKTTGNQSIDGVKTFSDGLISNGLTLNGALGSDGGTIEAYVDSFVVDGGVFGTGFGVDPLSPSGATSDSGNLTFKYRSASTTISRSLNVNSTGVLLYNGSTLFTAANVNGGASTIMTSNLTGSRALVSNIDGKVAISATTATQISYLSDVTSLVQAQLNGKAASSHTHGSISSTGTATNTDFSPGSGVKLMVSDSTNTIGKSSIQLVGSGATGYLRQDGQWINPIPTNNIAGSTYPGVYNVPGGGANTGVILYGDFYGWHTRSIGTAGQFLTVSSGTPNWIHKSTSITASAAVSSSTAATINVTGYRMVLVQVWRNTTDQSYSFWVDLTDTTYNFSTTARNLRFRWWDGSSGWDNTITVQNSSGLRLQHNAGGTFIFKCTGVR
jgi:hypothetical protein